MITRLYILSWARILACLVVFSLAPSARAASGSATWSGATDGLWSTPGNWSGSLIPGAGNTATFSAASGNAGITVGTISLANITFDTASAAAYTLGATPGTGTLTFADGTTNAVTMNSTVTANEIINSNITLGTAIASATTFQNDSTAGLLTLGGNITGGTGGSAAAKTVIFTGAGNTTVGGVIGNGGASSFSLTKSGSGMLTLSGANTFTGGVTINGGTIDVASWNARQTIGVWGNAAATSTLIQMNAGRINYTGASVSGWLQGVNLASGNNTIDVITGSTLNFAGTNLFQSSGGNLIKEGGGALQLAYGAYIDNIFTGKVTINAGTLEWWSSGNMPVPGSVVSDFITINNGGTFSLSATGPSSLSANMGFNLTGIAAIVVEGGVTIAGVIADGSSAGGLTKSGNGTLTLSGTNTYSGTTTVNLGTLAYGINNAIGTGNLTVSGGNLAMGTYNGTVGAVTVTSGNITGTGTLTSTSGFTINNSANSTISAILGGAVDLSKSGAGTLTLTAANTYNGTTTVSAGTLAYGINNAIGTGNLTVSGGNLSMGTYNGTVGAVTVTSGNITGTGGTLTSASGFTINNSGNSTISAILGGSVGLSKSGAGTLTLTAANTYNGTTTVNAGTLAYGINNAIATGNVTLSGGDLAMGTYTDSVGAVTVTSGNITGTGTLTSTSGFTINNSGNSTISAILGGSVGLSKSGAGTLTLTAANTYNGTTTVNAGTLAYGINNAIATGNVTLSGGDLAMGTYTDSVGAVTVTSGNITGAGTLTSTSGFTINNSGNSAISAILGGSVNLTKSGSGMLTLSGANTFTGGVTINGGTIDVASWNARQTIGVWGNAAATSTLIQMNAGRINYTGASVSGWLQGVNLASGNNTIDVITGSTLMFAGTNLFQSSGGNLIKEGGGALQLAYGGYIDNIFTGKVTINAGTLEWWSAGSMPVPGSVVSDFITINNGGTFALAFTGGSSLSANIGFNLTGSATISVEGGVTIAGVIADGSSAGGLTKSGSGTGTLTLSGANTYTGTTTVSAGTLTLNRATGSLVASALTMTGGTFNMDNVGASGALSQNLGALTFSAGDGTVKTTRTVAQDELITFSSLAARTAGATGNFVNGGGTNGITNGFVLTTGATANSFIDRGIFYGGSAYAWYDAAGFVRAINYSGDTGAVTSGATTTLSSSTHQKVTGAISAQQTATFSDINIAGNYNITMQNPSQTLTVDGILKSGNAAGGATISGGTGIQASSGTEMVVRTDGANDALTISSPILANGNSSLTKSGAGTLTLSGNNTYTGATTTNAGMLRSANNGALSTTSSITVNNAGSTLAVNYGGSGVDYNQTQVDTLLGKTTFGVTAAAFGFDTTNVSGNATYGTALTMAAGVTKLGANTLILAANNTYTGTTTVSAGVLNIQNATALGTTAGSTSVTSGAALQIQNDITVGAEALALNGTGISADGALRNISGANVWQGLVTLGSAARINSDAGSLTFNTAANSITGSNKALTLGGAGNGTVGGTITTGTGALAKDGAGTWTLSGANSYTGLTTVSAGTLVAGTNSSASTNGAFGNAASAIVLGDAATTLNNSNVALLIGGAFTVGRDITIANQATSGIYMIGGNTADSSIFSGAIALNQGLTVTAANGGTVNLTKSITNASGTNTVSVTGAGTSNVVLNDLTPNQFAPTAFSVNSGMLSLGASNQVADTAAVTVAGGRFDTGGFSDTFGALTLSSGSLTGTTGALTASSYAMQSGSASAILAGTGPVTKTTGGTVTLTGANTFTGVTTLSAGTLSVSTIGDGGVAGNLGQASNAASNLVFDGGTLQYTGASASTDRNFMINSGKTAVFEITTSTLTLTGGAAATNGDITKTGAGTLILTGSCNNSGAITVSAGVLIVNGPLANTTAVNVNAGTLQLGAANRINIAASLTMSGGTLDVAGYSQSLGVLGLTSSTTSYLDFGTGASTLLFSSITPANGILAITNWTEGSDSLRFTSNVNLIASSFTVNGLAAGIVNQGSYYEVVTPEPATWALLALGLISLVIFKWSRRESKTENRSS